MASETLKYEGKTFFWCVLLSAFYSTCCIFRPANIFSCFLHFFLNSTCLASFRFVLMQKKVKFEKMILIHSLKLHTGCCICLFPLKIIMRENFGKAGQYFLVTE